MTENLKSKKKLWKALKGILNFCRCSKGSNEDEDAVHYSSGESDEETRIRFV
jgi:hypothetical protein